MNSTPSLSDLIDLKNHKTQTQLTFLILITIGLSWIGVFDGLAENYINDALVQSSAAFAVAKSLNGMISVLQSSTVDLSLGVGFSVAIGEVLDPVNDMVEDYSSLMKMSIGSLVIQKLLVEIVSDGLFKVLLTLSGIALIAGFFIQQGRYINVLVKTFVFLLFLRFLIVLIVILNSFVDRAFIAEKVNTQVQQLESVANEVKIESEKNEFSHPSGLAEPEVEELEKNLSQLQIEAEKLEKQISAKEGNLKSQSSELKILDEKIESFQTKLGLEQYNFFTDGSKQDQVIKEKISVLKKERTIIEDSISRIEKEVESISNQLEANIKQQNEIQNTLAGKANSVGEAMSNGFSKLSAKVSSASANVDITAVNEKLTNSINSMISIMTIFLFKTLILPLLFLFLFLKISNHIWGIDIKEKLQTETRNLISEMKEGLSQNETIKSEQKQIV
ncbi:MAG: hypothetical protein JXK16_13345 [Thiotrichales bacterium]|nr:hypothetical protein [Thiotrichales bacterium]